MAPPTTIDLSKIKRLEWSTTTTYTVSDIIAYNLALGAAGSDLSLTYERHPTFHALPTFGCIHGIAVMSLVHSAMAEFLPNFQGHNHVHGGHYLKLGKSYPIPQGTEEVKLKTTARVVDIVDRVKGVLVVVQLVTIDEKSGEAVCQNEWTGFVLQIPTDGASKIARRREANPTLHDTPSRKPDMVLAHQTSPEQAALYRAASGDLNPLHIDPETAKEAGFRAPILTGTCTLGIGVRHAIEAFAAGDASRFESVKVRLNKPVFAALGEEVRTEMWLEGSTVLFRMVVAQSDGVQKIVMSNGIIGLKPRSNNTKL